jgi:hypothetical protein
MHKFQRTEAPGPALAKKRLFHLFMIRDIFQNPLGFGKAFPKIFSKSRFIGPELHGGGF